MASSSSTSFNWVYDVFPSFSGEDVRVTFLSHFLKELDRRLIIAFKDNEIEKSQSLDPALKLAIRTSKIAVVVFSEKYPSSSWCLDELLEIVTCNKESGQLIIPVFYGLDPSHVRRQTGKFGEAFAKTCLKKTEDETKLWRKSLTDVANVLGYHSQTWPNEANMIEAIANDVLGKLKFTPLNDLKDFVGMEDHIAKMSDLLHLDSEEVRMVGIWGPSGIGKTSIARALYSRLTPRFQSSAFVDMAFVSKSRGIYSCANSDDYNMKLHLQTTFLSEILDKKDIKIDRLGAVEERLKHHKVLIFIDDLDDQVVLDTLAGQTQWFGGGSRIIVITKDRQFLRAHGIKYIYNVCLPYPELALKIFCRSAFGKNSPPDGLMELASEVVLLAGNLPLGLNVLGSSLRGRDKEDLMDMLPRLRNSLDGRIEKTLRVSYDGLSDEQDKAIFRHIACLFNGVKVDDIKLLLADRGFNVNYGLKNLVDKSLVHIREDTNIAMMHTLLQEMGKKIVRAQSSEPGEREFLVDAKEICDLLEYNTGTRKVLGIALDMDEIDELHIHENAFKEMCNLLFLKIYTKKSDRKTEVRWYLPEGFSYFPQKLRLLRLDGYPMRYLPSNFRTDNLIELQLSGCKLEKLWEGVHSLGRLKAIDLHRSVNLKEIPNLSMATNLKKLNLEDCSSLVELPSSIQYLNKLEMLNMMGCINLETLPTGINLQSLSWLNLSGCSRLNICPDISTNITDLYLSGTGIETFPLRLENLFEIIMMRMKSEKLWGRVQPLTPLMAILPHSLEVLYLSNIPSLVELPASIQNFTKLGSLTITDCINLETLPIGINFPFLVELYLRGCSRLKSFPNISTNIFDLNLDRTGIEEVPWWIEKFSYLNRLLMNGCNKLQCVSLHISKLKHLRRLEFSDCPALTKASWSDSANVVAMATDNFHQLKLPVVLDEASSSFPDNFINFFNFNFYEGPTFRSKLGPKYKYISRSPYHTTKYMTLSGEEVLSYFTHRTTRMSLTDIPLLQTSLSHPFFRFKACVVVDSISAPYDDLFILDIDVSCRFKGRLGTHFDSLHQPYMMVTCKGIHLIIFECCFPLKEENASLTELKYDRVDIQLRLSNSSFSTSKLKEWGIRLSDDFSSPEIRLGNGNTLPHCEADEDNMVNETGHNEESGDRNVETERSKKRIRMTQEKHNMSL